ncbi:MAG TPA: hypothetical protein VFV34_28655 [Blastocatellia bacterium]|nr:hypothetical protein [Blastocatellia bacterium]
MARNRYEGVIEATIVATMVAIIAYVAIPPGPSSAERRKVAQMVGPIDVTDAEAEAVLQQIVNTLDVPVRIALCKNLGSKRITLKTPDAVKLQDLLHQIGAQLGADVKLFSGIHGEGAFPRLECPGYRAEVVIEKNNG